VKCTVDLDEKKAQLFELYEKFERDAASYKAQAVCAKGCAYCCIEVGSVGTTTLEGLVILEYLNGWSRQAQSEIRRRLRQNRNEKQSRLLVRCAFLDEEHCCRIYPVRPFSCRRLYSVRKCEGQGPVIHRQAFELARQTERDLQRLDPWGCSGHISFILHLLEKKPFRRGYLRGRWDPANFKTLLERYDLFLHRGSPARRTAQSPVRGRGDTAG
jgi:Fe-S-cluster containining protein